MALTARTSCGLTKFRAVHPGGTIALVAPASPFAPEDLESGRAELARLGFDSVHDSSLLERGPIVAGSPETRARALTAAVGRTDVDAIVAMRGGYGSMELLPHLDANLFRARPLPLVGYSDITALHIWLNGHVGVTSVHGAMIEGRIARGPSGYDAESFLGALGPVPLGELTDDGLEIVRAGEISGPLVGGTLTQLAASLGTPFDFRPPDHAVLFLEDVAERPYRIRRLLTQLAQAGRFARASALVFGQMPRCDEQDGRVTARSVIEEFVQTFPGPVLFGFPSGHTTSRLVSLPFGVRTRVVASGQPRLVIEESAAE